MLKGLAYLRSDRSDPQLVTDKEITKSNPLIKSTKALQKGIEARHEVEVERIRKKYRKQVREEEICEEMR
jgi:hypothetical protein